MAEKIKILFLAANPIDSSRLRLDEELHEMERRIQRGAERDRFELISQWAVTSDNLQQALLRHRPHIVHFSGHGSKTQGIALQDKLGKSTLMSKTALIDLFKILKDNIRIIVLNDCYSAQQAEGLSEIIDFTVGVHASPTDKSATGFAANFYEALALSPSVADAFVTAKSRLKADCVDNSELPEFIVRKGAKDSEPLLPAEPPKRKRPKSSTKIRATKSTIVVGRENDVMQGSRKKAGIKRLPLIICITITAALFLLIPFRYMLVPDLHKATDLQITSPPRTCKLPGNSASFSVDVNYDPSGKMGDIGDITIEKDAGVIRFIYETLGNGPHEWDWTYGGATIYSEIPAQFAGVTYLNPPNNWGVDPHGGFDLRGYRGIRWEARSLKDEVKVEFLTGGINWMWDDQTKKKVDPPYPDSLRRQPLGGIKTLTPRWQSFEFDLTSANIPEDELACVIGAFSWIISWGSNGVKPKAKETGPVNPKVLAIELRNIAYER